MSPGLSVVSVLKVCYMYGALPLVALCTICVIIAFRCWSVPQRRYCTMIRALQLYSPGAASGPLARRSRGSHRAPRVWALLTGCRLNLPLGIPLGGALHV